MYPSVAIAFVLSAAAGVLTAGATMPPTPDFERPGFVLRVNGCHADTRRGYVRELGRTVRHFHRGGDCKVVIAEGKDRDRRDARDCHRDVRTHRIGGALVTHRHVGDNCRVREVRRSSTVAP